MLIKEKVVDCSNGLQYSETLWNAGSDNNACLTNSVLPVPDSPDIETVLELPEATSPLIRFNNSNSWSLFD